ncbi:hypothetical protein [Nitratireductor sp. GCM10026969]|uniref:hypothetical protein n=1 Tax=Nitratireductor sp. GCM10026969 TaxID=3252645 RepID=UPI00360D743C
MSLAAEETTPAFDKAAAEAFTGKMAEALESGAVAVMLGFGHTLGLFDAMAVLPPSTSEEIAAEAGLDERYVREWLAVMVTGRVVLYDPVGRRYRLPEEHAACLTRGAPFGNLALYGRFLALMGQAQDHVLAGFRTG